MIEAVCVVIPVHDEATHLTDCLAGLDAAVAGIGAQVRAIAIVVLDACTDGSAAIARAWADREPDRIVLGVDCTNVGAARAVGMQRAVDQLAPLEPARIWLATTDADSVVPGDWLASQLALAAARIEAVAGSIRVADWSEHPADLGRRFRNFYEAGGLLDTHPHVHGANLGVRADAYLQVGGFPAVATGEDHALWRALAQAGRRTITSRRIAVTTSARRRARAPGGFGHFLETLARAPEEPSGL